MPTEPTGRRRIANDEPAAQAVAWAAASFVTLQVGLIPFGMVPPAWFTLATGALGGGTLLAARLLCPARWSRVTLWPMLLLLGAYAVATALGTSPSLSAQRFSALPLQALLFPCVQLCAWRSRALVAALGAVALAVCAMAFDGAWARSMGGSPFHQLGIEKGRRAGSQGNANDMAAAAVLLPIALAVVPPTAHRGWALLLACAGAVPGLAVASRQAVGGWAVACVAWATATGSRRRALVVLAGTASVLAASVALHPGLRKRAAMLLHEGLGMRQQLVEHGWSCFLERPVLGWGPGLYRELHSAGIESGWQSGGKPLPNVVIPWVHCLPVEVLLDTGVLGFSAAVTVVATAMRRSWASRGGSCVASRAAVAGGCALAVIVAIGLVDLSLLKDWVRCTLWLSLGLAFLQRESTAERPEPAPREFLA